MVYVFSYETLVHYVHSDKLANFTIATIKSKACVTLCFGSYYNWEIQELFLYAPRNTHKKVKNKIQSFVLFVHMKMSFSLLIKLCPGFKCFFAVLKFVADYYTNLLFFFYSFQPVFFFRDKHTIRLSLHCNS